MVPEEMVEHMEEDENKVEKSKPEKIVNDKGEKMKNEDNDVEKTMAEADKIEVQNADKISDSRGTKLLHHHRKKYGKLIVQNNSIYSLFH